MKPASEELKAFINEVIASGNRQMVIADAYTLAFYDGSRARYTSAQRTFSGIPPFDTTPKTFVAGDVTIEGLRYRLAVGVEVDEAEVKIGYTDQSLIQGQQWRKAILTGQFDSCRIQRDRFFFREWGQAPVGSVPMFHGKVSTIDKVGRTEATIKVKSDLVILDQQMPRRLFQPSCLNILYDNQCGLVKGDHAVNGTIGADPTRSYIPFTGSSADLTLGTIAVQIAVSLTQSRTIVSADSAGCWLSYPLDYEPAEGMQITAFKGCDKTVATCKNRFNNKSKYVGFPYVPPPEYSV
jgi:uncharacterized phage protein (TIGR02218 family)